MFEGEKREKRNVTVSGSESNETFILREPRHRQTADRTTREFDALTLGPGLGTSDSGKRPAEVSVLGFVSLGIPGTNHKELVQIMRAPLSYVYRSPYSVLTGACGSPRSMGGE